MNSLVGFPICSFLKGPEEQYLQTIDILDLSHFTDWETKAQKGNDLAKITSLFDD